jgi:hypothetical protein
MDVSGQLHAPVTFSAGKAPGINGIGDWIAARAYLAVVKRRNISATVGNRIPVVQLVDSVHLLTEIPHSDGRSQWILLYHFVELII